jgi:hypothetical protein
MQGTPAYPVGTGVPLGDGPSRSARPPRKVASALCLFHEFDEI